MNWATFARTRRLVRYARQMAEKPDASTPRQTESWSECKAVYGLFKCPKATFAAVTAAHNKRTLKLPPGKYLAISDTTEVDYGYKSKRAGLGPLTAKHRRGFFLHSALVVDPRTRQVMGLGGQELWARSAGKKPRVHRVACRKRPTESDVWGRVMDRVATYWRATKDRAALAALVPALPGAALSCKTLPRAVARESNHKGHEGHEEYEERKVRIRNAYEEVETEVGHRVERSSD